MKRLKDNIPLLSFLFIIVTFLVGVFIANLRFSFYEFDSFIYYEITDYLKVFFRSSDRIAVFLVGIILFFIVSVFALVLKIKTEKMRGSSTLGNALLLCLPIIAFMFIVGSLESSYRYDYLKVKSGVNGLFNIEYKDSKATLDCVSIIDINTNYVFVWEHEKEYISAITKSQIYKISQVVNKIPSIPTVRNWAMRPTPQATAAKRQQPKKIEQVKEWLAASKSICGTRVSEDYVQKYIASYKPSEPE